RTIAIKERCYVFCQTLDKSYLIGPKVRSTRCYDVFNPGLMKLDDICIAFDQITVVLFGDGLSCLKNTIKDFTLMINLAFRRVQIFRNLFVRRQRTAAKSEYATRHAVDWKHHTRSESIGHSPIF